VISIQYSMYIVDWNQLWIACWWCLQMLLSRHETRACVLSSYLFRQSVRKAIGLPLWRDETMVVLLVRKTRRSLLDWIGGLASLESSCEVLGRPALFDEKGRRTGIITSGDLERFSTAHSTRFGAFLSRRRRLVKDKAAFARRKSSFSWARRS